jgi:hypothetical protein
VNARQFREQSGGILRPTFALSVEASLNNPFESRRNTYGKGIEGLEFVSRL